MSSNADLTAKIWWEQICSDRGATSSDMSDDEEDIVEAQLLNGLDEPSELASLLISEEEVYLY